MRQPLIVSCVTVAFSFFTAGAKPADAKLAPSEFSEMMAESTLIARVTVEETQVDRYRGHAVLKVVKVYKGTAPKDPIRLEFAGEVHDQVLPVKGEERLVFMVQKDGKWQGTHYGRSYWPLVMTEASKGKEAELATPYNYPTSMLRFTGKHKKLLEKARFPKVEKKHKIDQMIRLEALEQVIAAESAAGK